MTWRNIDCAGDLLFLIAIFAEDKKQKLGPNFSFQALSKIDFQHTMFILANEAQQGTCSGVMFRKQVSKHCHNFSF